MERSGSTESTAVLRSMQLGQHVLFVVLLAIGALRTGDAVAIVGAIALACWYAAGIAMVRRRADSRSSRVWLAGLVAGWLLLMVWSVEFSWVAFALFFIVVHVLPVRLAVVVAAVMTVAVVGMQLAHGTGGTLAGVLGPCVGAAVAVGMGVLYERLVAQDVRQRALVDDLVRAQGDLMTAHEALARAQREAGAEAERARLARDIHDTLAQGFSSIVLLSRAGLAGAEDRDVVLGRIERTAAENLDEARRVVLALAPSQLDGAPLAAALRRLLDALADDADLVATLTVDGEPFALPTTYDVALLRVAQSALANVRQHAGAAQVAVTLTFADDAVRLDVVDDGAGFDPAAVGARGAGGSGFGLPAMRSRLAELGGSLVVESGPGAGTAVAATVPLDPRVGA